MTVIDKIILAILAGGIAVIVVAWPIKGKMYPCDLAEISPDIPVMAKERCREERRLGR